MPAAAANYTPIGISEVKIIGLNFGPKLQAGETLSTCACAISVVSGSDPNASSRILQGPQIQSAIVVIKVGGGLRGVIYQLLYTVTTSLGQTLTSYANVPFTAP